MSDAAAVEHAHPDPRRAYWGVFAALILGTIATVCVALYVDIGRFGNIAIGVTIACIKASLVAYIFMHLKGEEKLIFGIALAPIILLMVIVFLVLPDIGLATISPAETDSYKTPAAHGVGHEH